MWLDMGSRVLDLTCARPEATRPMSAFQSLSQGEARLRCEGQAGNGTTKHPRAWKEHVACELEGCQEHHCASSLYATNQSLCIKGSEYISPPMMHPPLPVLAYALQPLGFDSAIRWPPRLYFWWQRANMKEVVDARPHGMPTCLNGTCDPRYYYTACGGKTAANASSMHIRTGWRATGGACRGCVVDDLYLNCGPASPPHAAQNKSRDLFARGVLSACGDTAKLVDGSGDGLVHGRCFHHRPSDGSKQPPATSPLNATSPAEFALAARKRRCRYAFLWWPPACGDATGGGETAGRRSRI